MAKAKERLQMLKLSIFAFVGLATIAFSSSANATCPTFHTLTNGSTADANQVMDNYNYILQCPNFTGSIGIGTSTPAQAINISANSSIGGSINIEYDDVGPNTNARNWVAGNAPGPNYGDFYFLVSPTKGGTPTTSALDITRNSYLGINTGSALARLDITGTAASSPLDIGLRFTETSTSANARNWLIAEGAFAYGDLSFLVSSSTGGVPGGTPVLYVSKGGTVGINMSTAPTQALEVNGQIKVDTLASASSTSLCINANVLSSCSSSRRYKENIRTANFGLKEIEAMRPVTFKWKGRDEADFGLIAEEVATVDPHFVTTKNGRIEGVKYPQLTAVLVNAVKELKAANDGQAAEIARLHAQNAAFQDQLKQQADAIRDVRARLDALERKTALHTAANLSTTRQ